MAWIEANKGLFNLDYILRIERGEIDMHGKTFDIFILTVCVGDEIVTENVQSFRFIDALFSAKKPDDLRRFFNYISAIQARR